MLFIKFEKIYVYLLNSGYTEVVANLKINLNNNNFLTLI